MPSGLETHLSKSIKYSEEKLILLEVARVFVSPAKILLLDFSQFESKTEFIPTILWSLESRFDTIVILTPWLTHLEKVDNVKAVMFGSMYNPRIKGSDLWHRIIREQHSTLLTRDEKLNEEARITKEVQNTDVSSLKMFKLISSFSVLDIIGYLCSLSVGPLYPLIGLFYADALVNIDEENDIRKYGLIFFLISLGFVVIGGVGSLCHHF